MNQQNNPKAPHLSAKWRGLGGVAAAGLCSYLTALCALPSSGLWSSLPTAAVLAAAAGFFCRDRRLICLLTGFMPFLLTCLYGFSLGRAVFIGAASLIMAWLGLLIRRAVITLRVGINVQRRAAFVLVLAAAGVIAVWLSCFGNPFSAYAAGNRVRRTAAETYGEALEVKGTFYDAFSRRYLTEIRFEGADRAKRAYMSVPGRDDYADFCRERLYAEAADYFERMTTLERDGVFCYFEAEDLTLSPHTDIASVLARMEYLLPVTSAVTDGEDFRSVVSQLLRYLRLSDTFVYKSVTVTASDSDGTLYFAVLNPDGTLSYPTDEDFFARTSEKFPEAVRK